MKEIKLIDNQPCKSTYHKKLVDQNGFVTAAGTEKNEEDGREEKVMQ